VPVLFKYLEGAPIRLLVERLVVRANLNDVSSGRKAYEFLPQLNSEPEYLRRRQQKSGKRREVDESYHVSANDSRVSSGKGSVTSNTRFKLQEKEDMEEHERVLERKADGRLSDDSLYAEPVANTEHTIRLATMRQSTESVNAQADPLMAVLEASILAQERSVTSFRALLLAHQKGLERDRRKSS
jgi:hypothetical protein